MNDILYGEKCNLQYYCVKQIHLFNGWYGVTDLFHKSKAVLRKPITDLAWIILCLSNFTHELMHEVSNSSKISLIKV